MLSIGGSVAGAQCACDETPIDDAACGFAE